MTDNTIPIDLPKSDDSRAVSPVIGVILMVAITIILAAVIGAFVLGFSTDTETPPNTAWSSSQNESVDAISNDDDLEIAFSLDTTDRSIDHNSLSVTFPDSGLERIDVKTDDDGSGDGPTAEASSESLSAGDSVTVTISENEDGDVDDLSELEGDRVRIVWEGEDTSTTLTTHTIN